MEKDTPIIDATLSYMPQGAFYSHPDITHAMETPPVKQKDRRESLKLALNDLNIGQRIHAEMKRQGRTVTWLAKQLCMERTSLYYTFRQNSINIEMLMKISAYLGHNFMQDVADIYKKYGL